MTVIDVHTHMLTLEWIELLARHGGAKYEVKNTAANQRAIHLHGAPFMTLLPGMWDYDLRIQRMDDAGVDVAIVSLSCPNVFFNEAVSLQAARQVNQSMADQQRERPARIRWMASLPWQLPQAAREELQRAHQAGAVGVMVLANIDGRDLTDPLFAPVWEAIDALALPVLVHPTAPQGVRDLHMQEFGLIPPVGFMFDTTLAISRMILSGFFDRYPNLKIIAAHGGGALPYIAGRLDRCHEMIPACASATKEKPSHCLRRIYYDTVVYELNALKLCIEVAGSPENVLYGSDYPHNIGDMKGCLARVNALPLEQRAPIAGKNAERLFRL
ncbi:MAG: amidohydrolase [Candidatus Solibacter usitatus]|nr:amidohydrolase [Candidatus Solibacter usitatus]